MLYHVEMTVRVPDNISVSIFDEERHEELHSLLSSLPLFPFMDLRVTPLVKHPSAIGPDAG